MDELLLFGGGGVALLAVAWWMTGGAKRYAPALIKMGFVLAIMAMTSGGCWLWGSMTAQASATEQLTAVLLNLKDRRGETIHNFCRAGYEAACPLMAQVDPKELGTQKEDQVANAPKW